MSVPAAAAFAATLAGCVLVSTSITLPPEADSGPRPDPADSGTANGADAVRMVLANLGQSVVLAAYRDADRSAAALEAATSAHAAAPTEATAEEARQAWRQAMIAWQAAELFTLGPAGEMGMGGVAGGRDLRSHIYSWPLSNPCRVDQEIVEAAYTDVDAFASEAPNVTGLDTIEYLLFRTDEGNACSPAALINSSGSWTALGASEVQARRAAYAHTAAILVHRATSELVGAWDAGGSDFVGELARAGQSSTTYASAQEGLNAFFASLFYLDDFVKDMKLGTPAGLTEDCMSSSCPQFRESLHADLGLEALLANMRSFRRAFLGGEPGLDGPGFDDLLRGVGAEDLLTRFVTAMDGAIAALEAVEGPLSEALASRIESVRAAHAAVKQITDLMKTELVSVLDLELPMRAEGDND